MLIIGCDFHPSFQMVSIFDKQTGEVRQMRLGHREEAERFYRSLPPAVRVGMEACGQWIWFERLLAELGHELWLGDAGQIRAMVVRQQKTTGGTRTTFSAYCCRIGFRASGCPAWKSGMCGSCWCIATSRCRRGRG